jgi:hypothetical protein
MAKITVLSDHRRVSKFKSAFNPTFQPALLLYYPELSLVEVCVNDGGLEDIERGLVSGIINSPLAIHSRGDYRYAVAKVLSLEKFVSLAHDLRSVVIPNPYYLISSSGEKMIWNRAGFIPPEGNHSYVVSVNFHPLGDTWVFGTPLNLQRTAEILEPNDFVNISSVGKLEGEMACFSVSSRSLENMKHALQKEGILIFSHSRSVNVSAPGGQVI